MPSTNLKESEDLAAIQAQLQLERAQLTNEISTRLTSISASSSPSKTNVTQRKENPFSMRNGNGSSSTSSGPLFFSSSSPFSHRPASLGLGAEPSEQDKKQAASSSENARLKGAITGKRKRDLEVTGDSMNEVDEEESKASAIGKNKGKELKGQGKAAMRDDPFASKKGKQKEKGKGKEKEKGEEKAKQSSLEQPISLNGASEEPSQEQLAGMSKSARKKLRKRMKKEAEEANARKVEETPVSNKVDHLEMEELMKEVEDETNPMTAHQKSMLSHLSGARFRQINETLYTTTSSSALSYIQGEPSKLREYHQGFREQVKSWPQVPVRQIAEKIQKAQKQSHQAGKQGSGRFAPGVLIIDLGAGEAILGKLLAKDGSRNVRVLSYDLLDSDDGWVKGLDIAKLNGLPLPGVLGTEDDEASHVVDVAVFCLSLMGTNWVEMIIEASRVLRTDGELIIAEVSSRFNTKATFVKIVSSLGFKLVSEDSSNSHFVLFEFVKLGKGKWDATKIHNEQDRQVLVEKGASVLKPCIYKRR